MRTLLRAAAIVLLGGAAACGSDADPTVPRGPSEWTARNWMGLCIQIGLFVLAIWGIWKLVEDPKGKGSDQSGGGNSSASP
jgi:hypothetical protein